MQSLSNTLGADSGVRALLLELDLRLLCPTA